jgi:colanic acid biosynthesis glycosyl transferase WcaI
MRIAMISQWYHPESFFVTDFSTWLVERGHDVSVITGFPNYPAGKVYEGYRISPLRRERFQGVHVVRVPLYPYHGSSFSRRVTNYASFAVSASSVGVGAIPSVDVVYVVAPPPTAAMPALVLKRLRGTPYVLHVQDLWPEAILDAGFLDSGLARRLVRNLVGRWLSGIYRNASSVAAISPTYRRALIERGACAKTTRVVYNWAAENRLDHPSQARVPRRLDGMDGRFVVMYAGNLGPLQGLDLAIRSARDLRDNTDIGLAIVGSGVVEEQLRGLAESIGASNVLFLGRRDPSEMHSLYAQADVHLVSLVDTPAMNATIPSKLQALLASGLPVITACGQDANSLVEDAEAGFVCPSRSVEGMSKVFLEASTTPAACLEQMGARGRRYYMEHLSFSRGARQLEDLLSEATASARPLQ